ncbi:hypothetical protein C1645_833450 [Glomus cerebriforme]|uniref:Uncharacterized protein n=1 Tax=Glomus cerebriforme TaxID=658196 RepID=A0A397SBI7_9GLOM|nr:hypothetical protein C1645_833450 [Glomus cerebriforme]
MNKIVQRLKAIHEESQAKDLFVLDLKANLESARDLIEKLQQERTNHICPSTQTLMNIENSNKEISSGSISTINTNDSLILKLITIPDDLPIQSQPDQLQELMNLDNHDDELPKPVISPPASNSKAKQPNKKKNKELTSHIVTGYTVLPKLKNNRQLQQKANIDASGRPSVSELPIWRNLISSSGKFHIKSSDKKSRGLTDTSKKSKHSSKDSKKKNKPKSQTSSISSTGSIAEILATLVKLLMKQEIKKSQKCSKSHGSRKAN